MNDNAGSHDRVCRDSMIRKYVGNVEADLTKRLRNDTHFSSTRLTSNQELCRIIFDRALADSQAQED